MDERGAREIEDLAANPLKLDSAVVSLRVLGGARYRVEQPEAREVAAACEMTQHAALLAFVEPEALGRDLDDRDRVVTELVARRAAQLVDETMEERVGHGGVDCVAHLGP